MKVDICPPLLQGQICDILTPASYESLPAPSGHTDSHTLDKYIRGGEEGRALILDRCRAFDLFASVNAHLWFFHSALGLYIRFCNILLYFLLYNGEVLCAVTVALRFANWNKLRKRRSETVFVNLLRRSPKESGRYEQPYLSSQPARLHRLNKDVQPKNSLSWCQRGTYVIQETFFESINFLLWRGPDIQQMNFVWWRYV